MRVVAICNNKGGVAKTTTTYNLGMILAGAKRVIEIVGQIRTEFERIRPVVLGTLATRVDLRTNRHLDGLEIMRASALAPLWAEIPLRNGDGRDRALLDAYEPVADRICQWLADEEVRP